MGTVLFGEKMIFVAWTTLLFFAFMLIHMVVSRITGTNRFMVKVMAIGLPLIVSPIVLPNLFPDTFWFFIQQPFLQWVCILVLITVWSGYIVALVCTQNSVSLRILDEMYVAQKAVGLNEIEKVYSEEESVGSRLSLMQKSGYLIQTKDMIEITPKANIFVYVTLIFRKIFGIINPG